MAYIVLNNSGTTGLLTVTLYSEQNHFTFVVDTGSNVSHLDKAASDVLKRNPKEPIPVNPTVGISGSLHSTAKMRQSFSSGIFVFDHTFLISDLSELSKALEEAGGPKIHGIIGTDLLSKYRCHIDFKKNRLHLG